MVAAGGPLPALIVTVSVSEAPPESLTSRVTV
jgi:hypothetical protein